MNGRATVRKAIRRPEPQRKALRARRTVPAAVVHHDRFDALGHVSTVRRQAGQAGQRQLTGVVGGYDDG